MKKSISFIFHEQHEFAINSSKLVDRQADKQAYIHTFKQTYIIVTFNGETMILFLLEHLIQDASD